MAVKIQVVFYVVTLCSVVVGSQCFGGPCCLHLQGAGSKVLRDEALIVGTAINDTLPKSKKGKAH
jgi:hypothetical protein